ncbi:MAG: NTP transferase domain-containing protein [bacterium]
MIQPIILAAGRNKRMKQKFLKSLHQLNGKTTLERILDTVESLGPGIAQPIIVVSPENKKIIVKMFKNRAQVITAPSKGTAYAVKVARKQAGRAKYILPLNGDHPFLQKRTLQRLIMSHRSKKAKLTLQTLVVPYFRGGYSGFKSFGRIIRKKGKIKEIRERTETTGREKRIKELNIGLIMANAPWIWQQLDRLKPHDNGEYYLTDIIRMAVICGDGINDSRSRDVLSAYSYNSPEDLERLKKIAHRKNL